MQKDKTIKKRAKIAVFREIISLDGFARLKIVSLDGTIGLTGNVVIDCAIKLCRRTKFSKKLPKSQFFDTKEYPRRVPSQESQRRYNRGTDNVIRRDDGLAASPLPYITTDYFFVCPFLGVFV